VARIIITSPADADTAKMIADLAASAGAFVAERYNARLDSLYDRLSDFPEIGAPRPLLGPHVRISIISPYLVIYEYDKAADTVTIMRVAHGRRKITPKFVRHK
jgi:toxin ParE1/3/4